MYLIRIVFISTTFILFLPIFCFSQTLEDALEKAADYFVESNAIDLSQQLIIGMQNYHSKKKDKTAELIETELYFALEKVLPEATMLLESQALAGVSSTNAIFIYGTYEQKGKITTLRLQALKGMISGEVLAQTSVNYSTDRSVNKALVAVLDIEADTLTEEQRKGFSDIFRAALAKSEQFNMASNAEIDKMDADQIQNTTGCTRDECATIIGEQLGVDRVISSSFTRLTESMFVLSAKMMDIKKGSIIITETVKHTGSLNTLDQALENLSVKLSSGSGSVQFLDDTGSTSFQGGVERITPKFSGDKKSRIAALFIGSTPSKVSVFFGNIKVGITPYQNLSLKAGQKIQITLKHVDYYDKTVELTLRGGTNEIEPIPLVSKYGSLSISSDPKNADIYLAGEKVGKTPYFNSHILSGLYLVSIDKHLYFPSENNKVRILAGKKTERNFRLKSNYGSLEIETKPLGTNVSLTNKDNELVENVVSPAKVRLIPGRYRLQISKTGYESLNFKATVARNKTQHILATEATLRKLEGKLIVSSNPYQKGASVLINGLKMGEVPAYLTLPAGRHMVSVESDYKRGSSEVVIQDGLGQSLEVDIYDQYSRYELIDQHNDWSWKMNTLITAGLLTGIYSYIEYKNTLNSLEDQKAEEDAMVDGQTEAEAKTHRDKAHKHNGTAKKHYTNHYVSLLISTGLLGAATWIWLDEPKNPDKVRWFPEIEPDGQVKWSFNIPF
jgi:hypothetical protein